MIKAIIFDCFGVLTTDGWLPFKHHYFGYSGPIFDQASELIHRTEANLLTYEDFTRQIAKLAGISPSQAHHEIARNVVNEDLFTYIKTDLKPHYRLGILSNAADNWLTELLGSKNMALFDAVALSYEIKALKPDRKAYETIATRLDALPEECVFVDDQEAYCEGARAAGMQACTYTSVATLKSSMAEIIH